VVLPYRRPADVSDVATANNSTKHGTKASAADSSSDDDEAEIATMTLDALHNMESRRGTTVCEFCDKPGHELGNCFFNPNNPANKLPAKMLERFMVGQGEIPSAGKDKKPGHCYPRPSLPALFCAPQRPALASRRRFANYPSFLDSSETAPVFHSRGAFVPGSLVSREPRTVALVDKSVATATEMGHVLLEFDDAFLRLTSVLLVEELGYNPTSVGCLADKGCTSSLTDSCVTPMEEPTNVVLGVCARDPESALYQLPSPVSRTSTAVDVSLAAADASVW
jgi:hypothetical protein